jgi:hypothetical protein
MEKKKQVFRFNDAELSLIKNSFAESDELLFAIRKVFLQMPLSEVDKSLLTAFKGNKELIAVLRKTFNPQIEPDAPLHQLIDLWMSIDLKDKPISELTPVFNARKILIELLEQGLKNLEKVIGGSPQKIDIKLSDFISLKGKSAEEFYAELTARNTLIAHVEAQLSQINILAGKKDESVEQTKDKLLKNSNK